MPGEIGLINLIIACQSILIENEVRYRLTYSEGSSRLILIFAGWGTDELLFSHVRFPGYDTIVVWDYRSFHIDWSIVERYDEICLIAWSLGVYVASQSVQAIEPRITARIAVSGTTSPFDRMRGIPEEFFYALLDSRDPAVADKFFRSMSTDACFVKCRPTLISAQLFDELQSIADRQILNVPSTMRWDVAVVGRRDNFFPWPAQRRAWQMCSTPIVMVDSDHYIDILSIVNNMIAVKGARFDIHEAVNADCAERLYALLRQNKIASEIGRAQNRVAILGTARSRIIRNVAALISDAELLLIGEDLDAGCVNLPDKKHTLKKSDPETALAKIESESIDHLFAAYEPINSVDRHLNNIGRVLSHGGYACLVVPVDGNLREINDIRKIKPRLLTADQWLQKTECHFETVCYEAYNRDIDYEDSEPIARRFEIEPSRLVTRLDGRYHLTYKMLIMILQKK